MLIIFSKPIDRKPKKQTVKNYWDIEIQKAIEERNKHPYNSAEYNLMDDLLKDLYEEKRKNTPKKEDHTKEILTFGGVVVASLITAAMDYREQNIVKRGQDFRMELGYASWKHNLDLDSCDRMVFNQAEKLSR